MLKCFTDRLRMVIHWPIMQNMQLWFSWFLVSNSPAALTASAKVSYAFCASPSLSSKAVMDLGLGTAGWTQQKYLFDLFFFSIGPCLYNKVHRTKKDPNLFLVLRLSNCSMALLDSVFLRPFAVLIQLWDQVRNLWHFCQHSFLELLLNLSFLRFIERCWAQYISWYGPTKIKIWCLQGTCM